ncbi:hypothetical protein GCM10027521_24690 [Amycolatopsis cihanbeyliensis]
MHVHALGQVEHRVGRVLRHRIPDPGLSGGQGHAHTQRVRHHYSTVDRNNPAKEMDSESDYRGCSYIHDPYVQGRYGITRAGRRLYKNSMTRTGAHRIFLIVDDTPTGSM